MDGRSEGKMLGIHRSIVKLGLFVLTTIYWLSGGALGTHFRGGIIMIRPVDGGAPAEVYAWLYSR